MKVTTLTVLSLFSLLALASAQEVKSEFYNFQGIYESRTLKFFSAYPEAINFYDLVDGPKVSDAFKIDINSIREQRVDDVTEHSDTQRTKDEDEDDEKLRLVTYTHCGLHGHFRALSESEPCTVFEEDFGGMCLGLRCPLLLKRSASCTCSGYVTKSQADAVEKFYKSLQNPVVVSALEAMSELKIEYHV